MWEQWHRALRAPSAHMQSTPVQQPVLLKVDRWHEAIVETSGERTTPRSRMTSFLKNSRVFRTAASSGYRPASSKASFSCSIATRRAK